MLIEASCQILKMLKRVCRFNLVKNSQWHDFFMIQKQ